ERFAEAEAAFGEAAARFEALANKPPRLPDDSYLLAVTYNNLGILARVRKSPPGADQLQTAQQWLTRARDLLTPLVGKSEKVAAYQRDLARTHSELGLVLMYLGHDKEAQARWEDAVRLLRTVAQGDRYDCDVRKELKVAYNNLWACHGRQIEVLKGQKNR